MGVWHNIHNRSHCVTPCHAAVLGPRRNGPAKRRTRGRSGRHRCGKKSRLTTVAELLAERRGGVKMKIVVGFRRVTLV